MNGRARSKVLVIGLRPFNEDAFIQRRLAIERIEEEKLGDIELLNSACAVLLCCYPGKYRLIESYFAQHFQLACQMGVMTAVFASGKDNVQVTEIRTAAYARLRAAAPVLDKGISDGAERNWEMQHLDRWAYFGDPEDEWRVAEAIARHNPGPPLGRPDIVTEPTMEALYPETEVLLKRAFWDCRTLRVERLTGGKSAMETLRVFANLASQGAGPQPMPFFLKAATPYRVEEEKENYRERAEPFIPFHLRPALNEVRSVSGLTGAILVGNFVESATTLRDALRDGHGAGAVFSLFEVTLRGLRSHALQTQPRRDVIGTFIDKRVRSHEIDLARIEKAAGCRLESKPVDLQQVVRRRADELEALEGAIHGDLHAGNVMVRNRDAIVIDFGSMGNGPLSVDPAILEISLAFGTDNRDEPELFDAWRRFIDDIFGEPMQPPPLTGLHYHYEWLAKGIREVRHLVACCGMTKDEALVVLCACLLRFCRLSPPDLGSNELVALAEKRRAYALVVADRLCRRYLDTT